MYKSRQSPSAPQLRNQAEERLAREKPAASRSLTSAESDQLVHELRVHQIELELQIAALRESREETEAALRLYEDLYEGAPVGYVTLSLDGAIQRTNKVAAQLFNSDSVRLRGQRLGLYIAPATRADFNAFYAAVLLSKSKQSCEVELQRDGLPPVLVALEGLLTADERECRIVVVDLTEQKEADQLKGKIEQLAKSAADSLPVMVSYWTAELRCAFANHAFIAWTGHKPQQMQGIRIQEYLGPERYHQSEPFLRGVLKGNAQSFESTLTKASGAVRNVWTQYFPDLRDGTLTGVLCLVSDITELRQAESVRSQLAAIVESANDAIVSTSRDGEILSWNPGAERLYGYRAAELIGHNHRLLVPADRWTRDSQVIAGVGRGEHVEHYETLRLRKDGALVAVDLTVSPIKDPSGQITGVSSIASDITQRRKLQEQLRLLETSVAHLRDMVLITEAAHADQEGPRIVFVNAAFERQTGYTRAEILGQEPRIFWGPKTDQQVLERIKTSLRSRQPVRAEIINYTKSGEEFWAELDIVPILNAAGEMTHWISIHRDITERRVLEGQLRQAQKMEAIGQLAGGVAHDFNNLLMAMMLNLDLLRESLPAVDEDSPLHNLDLLHKRAKTLTNQLLIFARQQHVQLQPLELNTALTNVLGMMQRLLGEQIELRADLSSSALWVEADLGLLDLVVINLCLNARDAMPSGGQLTIATSLVAFDAASMPPQADSRPGQFVCLQVTDNGCGMSANVLAHLFEPFFTTKEPGKGTGLGLSSVYGIVRQHQGWVSVASKPGSGATFGVYLPYLVGVKNAPPMRPLLQPKPGGSEMILLVEDEEMVRKLTTKILKRLGYQVLAAATASEALRLWEKHADQIGLLLTDMVMPEGTTGLQLAEKLRQAKPALKIVLMSGYSSEIVHNDMLSDEIDAFVTKPFDLETLATTLRELLDR